MAGKSVGGNATKAPKLPQKKQKKPRAEGDAGDGGSGGGRGGGDAPPRGRRAKKAQRSVLGFVLGAAACLGLWGWSLLVAVNKRKRDGRVLASMRRRALGYTDHARCRMDCRFVSEAQVEETLRRGRINGRKSDPAQRPCPKYVVDADVAAEGGAPGRAKSLQTVFSACRNETTVITVIDTGTDWPCGPC